MLKINKKFAGSSVALRPLDSGFMTFYRGSGYGDPSVEIAHQNFSGALSDLIGRCVPEDCTIDDLVRFLTEIAIAHQETCKLVSEKISVAAQSLAAQKKEEA